MPAHVLMLPYRFPPIGDGTERQALALSRALQARGTRVQVATARFRGLKPTETIEGVSVDRLPYAPDRRRLKRVAKYTFSLALTRYLLQRASQYDVLHCHMALFHIIPPLVIGRWRRRPVIVKIANSGPHGDVEQLWHFGQSNELGPIAGLLLHRAQLVATSREVVCALRQQGFPRIAHIPNGVDVSRFAPAGREERAKLRLQFALPSDGFVLGFMGRLEHQKAVDVLIKAWLQSDACRRGGTLCIAGAGPDAPTLRAMAEQEGALGTTVRFMGKVRAEAYLRALDGFVLPSRFEGLPNAVLEAMACGLACIGTQIGGTEDLIQHDQCGLLVPPDEARALAEAIDALQEPQRRSAFGKAARRRTESEFSLDQVARQYEELYARMVGECHATGA